MLFAWIRRRLIVLRSNICNPDLRRCLCLSGHFTLHSSAISSLLQLTSEILLWPDLALFCVLAFSLSSLQTNTHSTHCWCIHRAHTAHHLLWMHQKGQSIQLALQISTSYVLWQHQMSAPKWAASVQQYTRSNAWEDESRPWNGPSEPGLWACMANAAMSPSAKAALGFCPRLVAVLKLRWELQVKCSAQTDLGAGLNMEIPLPSLEQLRSVFLFCFFFPISSFSLQILFPPAKGC